jgi:hypothetical protein
VRTYDNKMEFVVEYTNPNFYSGNLIQDVILEKVRHWYRSGNQGIMAERDNIVVSNSRYWMIFGTNIRAVRPRTCQNQNCGEYYIYYFDIDGNFIGSKCLDDLDDVSFFNVYGLETLYRYYITDRDHNRVTDDCYPFFMQVFDENGNLAQRIPLAKLEDYNKYVEIENMSGYLVTDYQHKVFVGPVVKKIEEKTVSDVQ